MENVETIRVPESVLNELLDAANVGSDDVGPAGRFIVTAVAPGGLALVRSAGSRNRAQFSLGVIEYLKTHEVDTVVILLRKNDFSMGGMAFRATHREAEMFEAIVNGNSSQICLHTNSGAYGWNIFRPFL